MSRSRRRPTGAADPTRTGTALTAHALARVVPARTAGITLAALVGAGLVETVLRGDRAPHVPAAIRESKPT